MKYGINTLLWTSRFDLSHLGLLADIRSWGFECVEIARYSFENFPARLLREAAHNEGLEVTLCSALPAHLSLVTDDDTARGEAREFLTVAAEVAAELGAGVLAGPFLAGVGLFTGARRSEDEWKHAVDELRALTSTLRSCDVTLALEPLNRFETYVLNTAADAARLCGEVHDPYVGVLFDTFHANIEEKSLPEAVRTLGGHLAHVHLCENDRGVPGTGHVDFAATLEALAGVGYDGYCVLESFGANVPEIATAARLWRELLPEPEAFAREALTHLKTVEPRAASARQ